MTKDTAKFVYKLRDTDLVVCFAPSASNGAEQPIVARAETGANCTIALLVAKSYTLCVRSR